jgi:hypothetical protein
MAFATAVTTPITRRLDGAKFGASPCDSESRAVWDVMDRPDQEICLEEGEFQLTSSRGSRLIGRFTGRTRNMRGAACPTIEVFQVDTVVEMVGDLPVLVGRRGQRLEGGTWWTSPKAVA